MKRYKVTFAIIRIDGTKSFESFSVIAKSKNEAIKLAKTVLRKLVHKTELGQVFQVGKKLN